MSAELMREVFVEAILTDPYDGAIRLLGDAQRFGFGLLSLEHRTGNRTLRLLRGLEL